MINAAYRGVQDLSTYVRYFRYSVDKLGMVHGIDPDKITVWGQGTGGYLSISAYLKSYPEILQRKIQQNSFFQHKSVIYRW